MAGGSDTGRAQVRVGQVAAYVAPDLGQQDVAGQRGDDLALLRAPAACWCARAIVESTLTSQTMSPAASAQICNADKIAAHTPPRCQDGTIHTQTATAHTARAHPRHGAPTLVRQRIKRLRVSDAAINHFLNKA